MKENLNIIKDLKSTKSIYFHLGVAQRGIQSIILEVTGKLKILLGTSM
jgi:hypothetical protein